MHTHAGARLQRSSTLIQLPTTILHTFGWRRGVRNSRMRAAALLHCQGPKAPMAPIMEGLCMWLSQPSSPSASLLAATGTSAAAGPSPPQ